MKLIFALFAGYNTQNVTDDSGDLGRRRKQPGGEKEVEITLEEGPGKCLILLSLKTKEKIQI